MILYSFDINVEPYTRPVRTVQLSRIMDNQTYPELCIIPKKQVFTVENQVKFGIIFL